jgi:hypothetical protein
MVHLVLTSKRKRVRSCLVAWNGYGRAFLGAVVWYVKRCIVQLVGLHDAVAWALAWQIATGLDPQNFLPETTTHTLASPSYLVHY